jgi:hypothetical protein
MTKRLAVVVIRSDGQQLSAPSSSDQRIPVATEMRDSFADWHEITAAAAA